jgi:lipopolysaccharide export LptBFGC system permease protein LptF
MMLWTLQRYIFRELGKTFLLTAIGLMVVLGLGGGIMNMIELEQVTAWQMLKLMSFVLPVALALTLPIAALFSAATTYGRMSVDNEFVACRSGGINILALFAPTLVISLVSAAVTFAFINFIIPNLIRNLNTLVRTDLEQIVVRGLKAPGGFPLIRDRNRFFADNATVQTAPDNPAERWVQLDGVAFIETDGDDWIRAGSARTVVLSFDTARPDPTVTADMYGVSLIDRRKHQSTELQDHQRIGPHPLPQRLSLKVKWLNLTELFHYLAFPDEWTDIREQLDRIRAMAGAAKFYGRVLDDFRNHGRARMGDEQVTYDVQAGTVAADPTDGRLQLEGGVTIRETLPQGQRTIHAERAVLLAEIGSASPQVRAALEAFDNVTLSDPADTGKTLRKPRVKLDGFAIDPDIVAEIGGIPTAALLEDPALFPPGTDAARRRDGAVGARAAVLRDIAGVVHSRLAFSVSVFVLVILAAALGIIFRGAHVLTAFGIAFVPALFVIVTIVAGRQMAEKAGTTTAGLLLLWSGIAVVGGVDAWVLLKVLRR